MQAGEGGNTKLVAALQKLATSSSSDAIQHAAKEVLALAGAKVPGSLPTVQDQDSAPQQDQLQGSKAVPTSATAAAEAAASSGSSSRYDWQPPPAAEPALPYKMAAPLANTAAAMASAGRMLGPGPGTAIAAVAQAAQLVLSMVDQVRVNKAKVHALGTRIKSLLHYLKGFEPAWKQVEEAVAQKQQWEVLAAQLLQLEGALDQAKQLVGRYMRPMPLQRALRFLNCKLDHDKLCAVDAAISAGLAALTTTITSLNLVQNLQLGQQLTQLPAADVGSSLQLAHAEDEAALRQDLSQLVGGQQALEQQLEEANSEQRQQWQEAVSLLGSIQSGVNVLSSDMQAVMADVQELKLLVKGAKHQRPVSSQRVLDRQQVVWDIRDKLDSGGFGSVYAGTYDGEEVAVKQLDLAELDEDDRHKVFYEAAVLSRLHHPRIVQFFGVVVEQVLPSALSKKLQPRLSLVMERCDTNLAVLMCDEGLLPLPQALQIAKGIASALTYLHHTSKVKVVHGDLKPANVLLTEGGRVKLTDFGLSHTIAINTSTLMSQGMVGRGASSSSSGGTLLWTAPEVLEAWAASKCQKAAPAQDVYAVGLILYKLLTGRAPYKQYKHVEQLKSAVRGGKRPQWGNWQQRRADEAAGEVLQQLEQEAEGCWDQDPGRRPSAQEVQKRLQQLVRQLG